MAFVELSSDVNIPGMHVLLNSEKDVRKDSIKRALRSYDEQSMHVVVIV